MLTVDVGTKKSTLLYVHFGPRRLQLVVIIFQQRVLWRKIPAHACV